MSSLNSIARQFDFSAYSDLEEFKIVAHKKGVSTLQIVYGSKHEWDNGCGYEVPFRTVVRIDAKDGKRTPPFYAVKHKGYWPSIDEEERRMSAAITNTKTKLSEFSFLGDIRDDSIKL